MLKQNTGSQINIHSFPGLLLSILDSHYTILVIHIASYPNVEPNKPVSILSSMQLDRFVPTLKRIRGETKGVVHTDHLRRGIGELIKLI